MFSNDATGTNGSEVLYCHVLRCSESPFFTCNSVKILLYISIVRYKCIVIVDHNETVYTSGHVSNTIFHVSSLKLLKMQY